MRRNERSVDDPAVFREIMRRAEVGYLALTLNDGYPRIVPLDFVLLQDRVYFHGAREGEKFDVLSTSPAVSFSAVIPYATVPSYVFAEGYACPATHYFKSALVSGRGAIVGDFAEKAAALQALMEKYQPEGRYRPIRADDPFYSKHIERTAVFRIDAERVSVKVNLGESLQPGVRARLVAFLRERGRPVDLETAEEVLRVAPETF
jgi:nitroimidazol reductase NimA-like FMN-containing flavoprotein (pyridoxamine 5'-phosphate oxidase superfamily)